jgi:hypothetical protein
MELPARSNATVLGMRLTSRMFIVDVVLPAKSDTGEVVVAPIKRLMRESNPITLSAIKSPFTDGLSTCAGDVILS